MTTMNNEPNELASQHQKSAADDLIAYRARWICPISSVPIENGIIIIRGDKILEVSRYEDRENSIPATVIDLGDSIIFPGFINVHTHLEQPKVVEPPDTVFKYLAICDQNHKNLTKEQRTEIIQQNIAECQQYGTLALADFSSEGASDKVLDDSYLFARIFLELTGFKTYDAARIFKQSQEIIAQFPIQKKVTLHLAPSAPWRASGQLMKEICVNERHIAIHMAMIPAEQDFMLNGKGPLWQYLLANEDFDYTWEIPRMTPVQYFFNNHYFARHNLLIHMICVTETDLDLVKGSSVKVNICLCPRSSDTLNLGATPVKKIMERGINLCMGTESSTLVDDLDMRKEIIRCIDKFGVSPEFAFKFATLNGAYAIGFHKEVGSLEPGKTSRCLKIACDPSILNDPYTAILDLSRPVQWLAESLSNPSQ
jgi:cytosine/adenosine deaminase-related metal-dependent hydrolase